MAEHERNVVPSQPSHYDMAPCWEQPGKQWWHWQCALRHPFRFLRSRGPMRWRPGA